ncbi:hypothetical protein GW17_00026103 [Ensete ventricosum]|nr:hypothetical protein GW17_00026103 [Ensete ventricosum]
MRLGTHHECVGSSPRVSRVCQDDKREFAERRPRVTEILSRVTKRLAGRFDLHPKNTNSGRQCASRRRTQEVDVGQG